MPRWTTDVPKNPKGQPLALKRTPRAKPIVAIITSEDLIGCYTHFWGGHTVPCDGPDCPACLEGIPYRWHGYIGCVDVATREHFIFEMTAQAAENFKLYREAQGTLRGCIFEARRLRPVANSRVCIRTKPGDLRQNTLPKAPDVRKSMAIIWQLPDPDVEINGLLNDVGRLQTTNTRSNDNGNRAT